MALMMASQGKTSRSEIADAVGLSVRGIEEILKRISSNDFESTVMGRSRGHKKRVLEEEDEIKLVRLSRVTDENGLKKWTLRGLKEIFVTSGGKQVSHETIRRVLNKYKDTKDPDKVELDKNTIDKDS
jgi:transposase